MIPRRNLFFDNLYKNPMLSVRTLTSLVLFSSSICLGQAQQAPAPAQATPTPGQPSLPTTIPPGPPIARDDLTPEQKEVMKEVDRLRAEKALLDAKIALADAKRTEELVPVNSEVLRLNSERALRMAKAAAEAAALEDERVRLERQASLEAARANARLAEKNNKIKELEAEAKQLQLESSNTVTRLNNDINRFQKEEEARKIAANAKPQYLKDPLVNGTLIISDRRIPLNGAITDQLAEFVCQRINFYNNQSTEFPIFLVVDSSPGGSVSAGYQIQKAMVASKAPVYVVVKAYAASMTAVIATLAERSFCYPNSIILHHQVSSNLKGNMTVLKEQMEFTTIWFERMATPVAKKMGITLQEFVKKMYENDSTGDWQAFGEKAQQLKWINQVVERMEETAVLDILSAPPTPAVLPARAGQEATFGISSQVDDKGRTIFTLPALANPFDAWWIYDPHGLYRAL
jgi:ATP-dependent Clp protease protease subunit